MIVRMIVHNLSLMYGMFKFMCYCLLLPFKLLGRMIFNSSSNKTKVVYKKNNYNKYKEADLYHLTDYERKLAYEERMTPSEFVEAEERDDDNLDIDD